MGVVRNGEYPVKWDSETVQALTGTLPLLGHGSSQRALLPEKKAVERTGGRIILKSNDR